MALAGIISNHNSRYVCYFTLVLKYARYVPTLPLACQVANRQAKVPSVTGKLQPRKVEGTECGRNVEVP